MLHLYSETILSKQISDVTKFFGSYESIDISKVSVVKKVDIYFVEIQKIEKTLLLHIRKLLSDKTDSLIYFFINDSQNLMLLQLAIFLNVKSIITPNHEIQKIVANINTDILLKKTTIQNKEITNNLFNSISFMIFVAKDLTFASEKMLYDFKCKDLKMLELNLCSKIDVNLFLNSDTSKEVTITIENISKTYNIKSSTSKFNSDKYIFVEDIAQKQSSKKTNIDFIKNRIYFIEMLKEKLLEKKSTKHSLITIGIENINNLSKFWSEYEIEMAIRDLLLEIELNIESEILFAQYNNNLYITLLKDLDFEATKQKAQNIQTQILEYISKKEIKLIVALHAFDISDFLLDDALEIISDIAKEEISSKGTKTQKIHRIINEVSEFDDEKAIDILLQTTFINNIPIKLLNIYKGLCINNDAAIVKKNKDGIYVSFEQLQGTAMNFEKTTIIQSAGFTKDIKADVKLIDTKKRIALLKNFRFVLGNANARKNSRVTSSQRMPISMVNKKGSLNGEILDISVNSIAIKTRLLKRIEELNETVMELRFTLPIKSSQDGYMKLELAAKVIFIKCNEEYCKIVVDLIETQTHESILMEYVYDRQKELIIELKKQTIMRN